MLKILNSLIELSKMTYKAQTITLGPNKNNDDGAIQFIECTNHEK